MSLPGVTQFVANQIGKAQDINQQFAEAQRATLQFLSPQLAVSQVTGDQQGTPKIKSSQSNTPIVSRRNSADISGNTFLQGPRRYLNGWSKEQEDLMAEWADKAACYRWLHDRCEKKFSMLNMAFTIPVIVLSTLTGTANFAIGSLVNNDLDSQRYAQATIGCISLITGIISTVANFLRYAQGTESHRVAGIAWGKFQRQIAVELAIPHGERIDCMDFLKICRAELDRLIEQSPAIPDEVIAEFQKQFGEVKNIKKPEICHGLEHTRVFQDNASRLKQITSEAALTLLHKKRMLREEVVPDLNNIISSVVQKQIQDLSGAIVSLHDRAHTKRSSVLNILSDSQRKSNMSADMDYKKAARVKKVEEILQKGLEANDQGSDVHIEIIGSETT